MLLCFLHLPAAGWVGIARFNGAFVIVSARIIDLSGLATKDQMLSLLRAETEAYGGDEPVIALVARKKL